MLLETNPISVAFEAMDQATTTPEERVEADFWQQNTRLHIDNWRAGLFDTKEGTGHFFLYGLRRVNVYRWSQDRAGFFRAATLRQTLEYRERILRNLGILPEGVPIEAFKALPISNEPLRDRPLLRSADDLFVDALTEVPGMTIRFNFGDNGRTAVGLPPSPHITAYLSTEAVQKVLQNFG